MKLSGKFLFLLVTVISCLCSMHAGAQMQWGWARSFGGANNERPAALAADSRNGVYVFGSYSGSITVGGNTLTSPGGASIYLVKYDTLGNVVWAKSFGSGGQDTAANITTDRNSSIIITGSFAGTISFGSTVLTSTGGNDVFIVKLRPDGTVVWAKQFTGSLSDRGGPLVCDGQSNIYTGGAYRSNDFTIDGSTFTAPQPYNVYYCRLDSNGNRVWAKNCSSGTSFGFYDFNLPASGNLLMEGTLGGGGPGVNFTTPFFSSGMNTLVSALFTVKTDANGNYISQSTIGNRAFAGGSAVTPGQGVAKVGSRNFLSNPAPFTQTFLCDQNNNVAYGRNPDNLNFSNASSSMADVAAAKDGRIYAVGFSYGSNAWNGVPLNIPSLTQVFVVWEMDDTLAVSNILTTGYQPNVDQNLTRAAADTTTGTVYAAGYFSAQGTFTVGSNVLTSAGQNDVFIGQIKPGPQPAPVALKANAGPDVTICAGRFAFIGSAGATGGTPPYTYSWSPAAGLSAPTAASTQASPSATTTYILTVTDATAATAKDTMVLTVNALPPQPVVTAGGPTTFCQGDSVVLTSSPASSYSWNSGATTQSITAKTGGGYLVTVADANGCRSLQSSALVSVTVNPLPATPTVTAGGPTTFCQGGSVVLTSSAGSSYLWSNGATTQSITVSSSGSYSVQVTNASGCRSAASAAVTVTVNPLPATPTITAGGPIIFCQGGSVVLASSAGSSYLWSNGATTQSITVSSSGSYTVQVTNANGCQSAASSAVTVTVNPLPATPTITAGGPTTFCQGGSVVLTSSAGSSYLWSNGATTQSIAVSSSGSYTVQVTNTNGCQSAASTAVNVSVNPLPPVPIITQAGNTLTSSSATGNQWYFNGTAIAGATGQSYTYSTGGNYSVTVTGANGCSSSSAGITVLRMATVSLGNGQQFYHRTAPNPVPGRGAATIRYQLLTAAEVSVYVSDARGMQILQVLPRQQQAAGSYSFAIGSKLQALGRGLHYVVYIINGKRITEAVLVL